MKINSLTENHLFGRAYRSGESVAGRYTVVYKLKKYRTPVLRFGITVGKKLGSAVSRNRAKRVIREAYYLIAKEYEIRPCVIVTVARTRASLPETKTYDVYLDMKRAFLALGIIESAKDV